MPPNVIDIPIQNEPESAPGASSDKFESTATLVPRSEENFKLKIFQSSLNLLVHILIGIVVGISLVFSLRNGLPIGATPQHIILCVIGYQLLMAEAILSLSPHNGWSASLTLVQKRRAHWILQLVGSALAIIGSFIKILDKTIHWNTLHGQFALVAMIFTVICFFNGLTSLYAYELRKISSSKLSKLTHICFGIVAFATASISLCYGFDKGFFRSWVSNDMALTIIGFTVAFTVIIIINPFIVFFAKTMNIFKK